jgi:hypothetical protein
MLEPRRLLSHSPAIGNLLISVPDNPDYNTSKIFEVTSTGTLVQTIAPPAAQDRGLRDVVVDPSGAIQAYDGGFGNGGEVGTYANGSWSFHSGSGFSTYGVTDNGGIAVYQHYVYVTDESDQGPSGILRFDTANGYASQLFEGGGEFRQVSVGENGLLYAITDPGEPETGTIDIYDPVTMALIKTVTPPGAYNACVTADAAGNIFVGSDQGSLEKIDDNGNVLASYPEAAKSLAISPDGVIAAVMGNDHVLTFDDSLNKLTDAGDRSGNSGQEFVAFASYAGPPVPGTITGNVFNDANANGVQDKGEGGLKDAEVYVDSTHFAYTDRRGNYTITGVAPGSYRVREIPPAGYRQTVPNPAKRSFISVTVANDQTITGIDFGDTNKAASIAAPATPFSRSPIPAGDWQAFSWSSPNDAGKNGDLFS